MFHKIHIFGSHFKMIEDRLSINKLPNKRKKRHMKHMKT